jgi:hypothetical protein
VTDNERIEKIHRVILKRITALMDAKAGTAEARELSDGVDACIVLENYLFPVEEEHIESIEEKT